MYRDLIIEVWKYLKIKEWSKKSETFYFKRDNNLEIINFQKSKTSSSDDISFTINLGVSSTLLREFQGDNLGQSPTIEDSHWRIRLGFLLPENQDKWWKIDSKTILIDLAAEIKSKLENIAIPELEKYVSDKSLEKMWLSGSSNGLTEFQRYLHLTTLMRQHNSENLPLIIGEFLDFSKGKGFEGSAKVHIKSLNI